MHAVYISMRCLTKKKNRHVLTPSLPTHMRPVFVHDDHHHHHHALRCALVVLLLLLLFQSPMMQQQSPRQIPASIASKALTMHIACDWPVNYAARSPVHDTLCIAGDDKDCLLVDPRSCRRIAVLRGHTDYTFAAAWHPSGYVVATGNQDTTARLWDIRYLRSSMAMLRGRMAAIRSLRFDSSGQFLAVVEAADFVRVFDVQSSCTCAQELDFFGEIAGVSFTPNGESLFVGVADDTYGSLLEYDRKAIIERSSSKSHKVKSRTQIRQRVHE